MMTPEEQAALRRRVSREISRETERRMGGWQQRGAAEQARIMTDDDIGRLVDQRVAAALAAQPYTVAEAVRAVGIKLAELRSEAIDGIGKAIAAERARSGKALEQFSLEAAKMIREALAIEREKYQAEIATLRAELAAASQPKPSRRRETQAKPAALPAAVTNLLERRGAA
jgi:hypothetical protein